MAEPLERYQELGFGESLQQTFRYPIACKELSFILRQIYSKLPKNLQSLIFQDTLTAFRLLPQMQTQTAISAANLLLQSAEAALPKQKRALAVTEFKHAKVAQKRRCKAQQKEEGLIQLPRDVLVDIFSFLDLRSLVSAASVCRLWKSAASDNFLWHQQYVVFFGASNAYSKGSGQNSGVLNNGHISLEEGIPTTACVNWREAFKKAYEGNLSKKFMSYRGYCGHCKMIVWLSGMRCSNKDCTVNSKNQQVTLVSSEQIVGYILDDTLSMVSSSDSDSDSDGGSVFRVWAHLRIKA
ncbi:F-box protein At5g52880 [Cornus florida]|uniref:F-box protein At5g52880 n=1 Tax=Cornus florida TaxID=4283 RepID=UPI0028A285F7|nr:F-box protein At5g52880 [Cornus florida]